MEQRLKWALGFGVPLVAALISLITAFDFRLAILLSAGLIALLFLRLEPTAYLVILLIAGRFRGFPYADLFPEWLHASFFAAALLVIPLIGKQRRPLGQPGAVPLTRLVASGGVLLLVGWIVGAWAFAGADPRYALEKTVDVTLFNSLLFFAPLLVVRSEADFERVLMALVAGALVLALGAFLFSDDPTRLSAFGGGPNVFSRYMGLGAIICLTRLGSETGWRRYAAVGGLGLFTVATVMSGSRGPLLSLALVLLGYGLIMAIRQRNFKLVAGLVAVAVVGWVALSQAEFSMSRLALLFRKDRGVSVNTREQFLSTAFAMFKEKPLTGWGPGTFAGRVGWPGEKEYPHNVFGELAAEYGLIGLLGFTFMVGGSALALLKAKHQQAPLLLALMAFSLLVIQISGDLFDSRIAWFMSGLALALTALGDRETRPAVRPRAG